MEKTPALRYIWSTVRPLLQGKVLYAPDTPVARRLIKEVMANGTPSRRRTWPPRLLPVSLTSPDNATV